MTRSLRKRHLQIWALWAVLIPVGIIAAWMAVPKKVTQELLQSEVLRTNDDTIAFVDKGDYSINILLDWSKANKIPLLRKLYDEKDKPEPTPNVMDSLKNEFSLEFINKELNVSSLLLYQVTDSTTNDVDKQELLGRIGGRGSRYFSLELPPNLVLGHDHEFVYEERFYKAKFILYDIIKKQAIDSVIFKTPL